MPRTKQPRKQNATANSEEIEIILEDIEKQFQIMLNDIENECNMGVQRISSRIDAALGRMIKEVREMTLEELMNADFQDENNDLNSENRVPEECTPSLHVPPSTNSQTTISADDGYATEGTVRVTKKNATKRTSRVDSKRAHTSSKTKTASRSTSVSKQSTTEAQKFGPVTPKVKPNTPLNILRRPRDDEMVLSMQGSPLLLSAGAQGRMAHISVPLHNGNVMSLMPINGLRTSDIPSLDEETMNQLATLKSHIEKVMYKK